MNSGSEAGDPAVQHDIEAIGDEEGFHSYAYSGASHDSRYVVPSSLDGTFTMSLTPSVAGFAPLEYGFARRNSASAGEATLLDSGAVSFYDPSSGVETITSQVDGGGRIVLESLDGPASPDLFEYDYHLPEGYRLELRADGSVDIVDADGVSSGVQIDAPWAYDSLGTAVPVRYEVDGNTLLFYVDHTAGDYAYPILADPFECITRIFSGSRSCQRKVVASAAGGAIAGATLGAGAGSLPGAAIGGTVGAVACWIFCSDDDE